MDEVAIKMPIVVQMDQLVANDYNPNRMPKTEMGLLGDCILRFGFLFPLVVTWDEPQQKYRIVDGYHRYEKLKQLGATKVSVIALNHLSYHEAVELTVLMNRIKGMHQVELMSDLVVNLEGLGVTDDEICEHLGMEQEEYLRLKQQLGIAHAFRDHPYGRAWEER